MCTTAAEDVFPRGDMCFRLPFMPWNGNQNAPMQTYATSLSQKAGLSSSRTNLESEIHISELSAARSVALGMHATRRMGCRPNRQLTLCA